jgi:hypothetical protein
MYIYACALAIPLPAISMQPAVLSGPVYVAYNVSQIWGSGYGQVEAGPSTYVRTPSAIICVVC